MDIKHNLFKQENDFLRKLVGNIITDIELKDITTCQICLDTIKPNDIVVIVGCNHYYCKKCLDTYITFNIKNRTINIKCPNPKCINKLDYHFINNKLKKHKNVLKLYETVLLDQCIKESKDMIFCPKKECSQITIKSCFTNKVNCCYCFNQFCFICTKPYNDGHKCTKQDLLTFVSDDLKEIFLSEGKNMKICPGCRSIVMKSGGCDTMKCPSCQIIFCWKCLRKDEDIKRKESIHYCGEYYGWNDDEVIYSDDESDDESDNEDDSENDDESDEEDSDDEGDNDESADE